MKIRTASLLILLGLAHAGYAAGFRLVANPSVPVSSLTKSAASDIFMKKTPKWSDGTDVVVIDQNRTSPVRALFTTAVHGKSVAAIVSYWQQQIFGGRAVPPVEQDSDARVLAALRNTPGAIGYVSADTPIEGLKAIEIH